MYPKEMTILVGKHSGNKLIATDTFYYSFYEVIDGNLKKVEINKKWNQSTMDIYEMILIHFFVNNQKEKFLTYVGYNTFKPNREEYLGLRLQNSEEEKLNIYFTTKALEAFEQFVKLIEMMKCRDFYEYAAHIISKKDVEKVVIRPSFEVKSSIAYIEDNEEYNFLRIQKQLEYYYRKSGNIIDAIDLENICKIIREFINFNLENHPRYEYSNILRIKCDKKITLEVKDVDLIHQLEKMRILDDLWLVMHGIIEKMPLQEESMSEKEELKRKRVKYLETCHKLNR